MISKLNKDFGCLYAKYNVKILSRVRVYPVK